MVFKCLFHIYYFMVENEEFSAFVIHLLADQNSITPQNRICKASYTVIIATCLWVHPSTQRENVTDITTTHEIQPHLSLLSYVSRHKKEEEEGREGGVKEEERQ